MLLWSDGCVHTQDPGISSTQAEGSYWPYEDGMKRDVFIKDSEGNVIIGKVSLRSVWRRGGRPLTPGPVSCLLSPGSGVARSDRLPRLLQRGDARMVVREPEEVPPGGALRRPVDCKYGSEAVGQSPVLSSACLSVK